MLLGNQIKVNVDSEIEITPLFALDEEELAEKVNSDLSFERSVYLVQ